MNADLTQPYLPASFQNGFAAMPLGSLAAELGGLRKSLQRNDYYTVLYSDKATGRLTVDFNQYALESQTIYFISPEQLHSLDIQAGALGVVLFFTQDFLERRGITAEFLVDLELFFNCDEAPLLRVEPSRSKAFGGILEKMLDEHDAKPPLYAESLGAHLTLLLIECRRMKARQAVENKLLTKPQAEIVRRFKRLVETNFKKERQVLAYAKRLSLTPNYLNEVIKRETGVSAKEFILNRVMLEAKRLAIYSDFQLKQISRQLGFSDVALELNKVLADEVVLYIKTRNYHWNVEGMNFSEMHKFYEAQYEQLDEYMDGIAERIRFIGHYSDARLADYLKLTHLSEPQYTTDQKEQLKNLLQDHEAFVVNLRGLITLFAEKYKDLGSSDFVTGLMEKHEKMAWMIRAHLK